MGGSSVKSSFTQPLALAHNACTTVLAMFALCRGVRMTSGQLSTFPRAFASVPKPWGKAVDKASFNQDFATEFRPSAIPGAGNGWWAMVDIPKGTVLRRVSVEDGSMM